MGNTNSNLHKFVHTPSTQDDWEAYSQQEWRSDRARELDRFGGVWRPEIARGGSMTAKLHFLEVQCRQQGEEITRTVAVDRAVPGKGAAEGTSKSRSTRSVPGAKSDKQQQLATKGTAGHWRERVHSARRRVLWIVWVSILFEGNLKSRRRMRRIDSLSYYISAVLDADVKRFLAEQHKCVQALEAGAAAASLALLPASSQPQAGVEEETAEATNAPPRKFKVKLSALVPGEAVPAQPAAAGDSPFSTATSAPLVPGQEPEPTLSSPTSASEAPAQGCYIALPAIRQGSAALSPTAPTEQRSGAPSPRTHSVDQASACSITPVGSDELPCGGDAMTASHAGDGPNLAMRATYSGPSFAVPSRFGYTPAFLRTVAPEAIKKQLRGCKGDADGPQASQPSFSDLVTRRRSTSGIVRFLPPVACAGDYAERASPSRAASVSDPLASAPEPLARLLPPLHDALQPQRSAKSSPFPGDALPGLLQSPPRGARQHSNLRKTFTTLRPEDIEAGDTAQHLARRGRSLSGLSSMKARHRQQDEEAEAMEAELAQFSKQFAEAQQLAREQAQAATRNAYEDSLRLLTMYVNRGNSGWASAHEWAAPTLLGKQDQDALKGGPDFGIHKATCLQALRKGSIAVQLMACEDPIVFPDGTCLDPWTSDPWDLVHFKHPDPPPDCMLGVPLGCRALMNLTAAVEVLCGKPSVSSLKVLLHLPDHLADKALLQLCSFKFCGLEPDNIWVLLQQQRHAYRYDASQQRFVASPDRTPPRSPGSGLAMLQLNWPGEAVRLDREGGRRRLPGTVLEQLEGAGVAWVVSQPGSDLSLQTRESCLDVMLMSFTMAAHSAGAALTTLQAVRSDSLGAVLGSTGAGAASRAPSVVLGRTDQAPVNKRGLQGLQGLLPVAELRGAELQSGTMKDALSGAKAPGGSGYLLGLGRYMFHMSVLKELLTSPASLRPKLQLFEACMHVSMHAGDLVAAEGNRTLCMEARQPAKLLVGHEDCRELAPLLRAQEASKAFRALAGQKGSAPIRAPGGAKPSHPAIPLGQASNHYDAFADDGAGDALDAQPSQRRQALSGRRRLVVFVTSNPISAAAVDAVLQFARPGHDVVHLATVVSGLSHMEFGQALLGTYAPQVAASLVDCQQDVLPMEGESAQMISLMGDHVDRVRADLVVMVSRALSPGTSHSSSILGSVTLAAVKRIAAPMLIINANSVAAMANAKRGPLKALVVAQRNSSELLRFLCEQLLQPSRGDQLLLGQIQPTGSLMSSATLDAARQQQQKTHGRLVSSFVQTAVSRGLAAPSLLPMDGDQLQDIAAVVASEHINLIGYPLPPSVHAIPEQLVHLTHSAKCGVLVFRNPRT